MMIFQIFNIAKIVKGIAANRFYIYAGLIIALLSFGGGAWVAWKLRAGMDAGATIRVIERNIEAKGELDEIRNNRGDRSDLIDGMRRGEF